MGVFFFLQCNIFVDPPHLLLSEQLCVHHLDLDRDQSEGLECQTPSVSVVVLHTNTDENKYKNFLQQITTSYERTEQQNMLLLEFDSVEVSVMQHSASDCPSGFKTYFGFNWHNKDHIFQANAKRSVFIVSWLCKKARNKMLKSFPLPHQSFGIMGNILAHMLLFEYNALLSLSL